MTTNVGTFNGGGSAQGNLKMTGNNARAGGPDLGRAFGTELSGRELAMRQHYVTPSNDEASLGAAGQGGMRSRSDAINNGRPVADLPPYYNNFDGLPVPYSAPDAMKENFMLRAAIREAAGDEIIRNTRGDAPGVIRTDPISDGEVAYLKSMKDQAELAKFDDYVETYIDPRQPGNMKWLMEIYPDYVNRRLQQAHTDYEFALRNQMIDSWGINTFDDLHFKYLVDQGKVSGPRLMNRRGTVDDRYTPGWLSPFNFQSPNKDSNMMALPFASAVHGRQPANPAQWQMNRENRPLGQGNNERSLAAGMYANARLGGGDFLGGAANENDAPVGGRRMP
jgi:hypothetical protein